MNASSSEHPNICLRGSPLAEKPNLAKNHLPVRLVSARAGRRAAQCSKSPSGGPCQDVRNCPEHHSGCDRSRSLDIFSV